MDITSFQNKRILSQEAWNSHKENVIKCGELVLVAKGVLDGYPDGCLIVGDGDSNLTSLTENQLVWVPALTVQSLINDSSLSAGDGTPSEVSDTGNAGTSNSFARADHTHKLTQSTIHSILGVNNSISNSRCRKISAGTGNPPTSANQGDIYIKY